MRTIASLYRYPVKGLSPELLDAVQLAAGDGFPLDRRLAITNGSWQFDAAQYRPRPKTAFLTLMQYEALAALRTRVTGDGSRLLIEAPDGRHIAAGLDDAASLDALSAFLIDYLGPRLPGTPRLVRSSVHRFTDVSVTSATYMSAVSLINLASVRALGEAMGRGLDPLRFRANVFFDGGRAWEELDWVDREIRLGGLRARILKRIRRCPATDVDPRTGVRDANVPQGLFDHFRHRDMGVYAEILDGGMLRPGDAVTVDMA